MDINEIRRLSLLYSKGIRPSGTVNFLRIFPEQVSARCEYADYRKYLTSAKWKAFAKEQIQRVGHCEACGRSTARLSVHHKHYRTLKHESEEDIAVLCGFCHSNLHFKEGIRKKKK